MGRHSLIPGSFFFVVLSREKIIGGGGVKKGILDDGRRRIGSLELTAVSLVSGYSHGLECK